MTGKSSTGEEYIGEFNTVLFAIGRTACTDGLNLSAVGVTTNTSNKKIEVDDHERTSNLNIFAIGDVIDGRPELTPVAIQAGKLLAKVCILSFKTSLII